MVFKRIYGDIFYIQIFQRCLILACFFVFKPSQTFEELLLCVSAESISFKVDTGLYSGAVITWVGHDLKPWGFFCFVFLIASLFRFSVAVGARRGDVQMWSDMSRVSLS